MIKCQKCGKWFSSKKGFNIHSSRMHGKQEVNKIQEVNINNSQIAEILDRVRKLELDNVFMKCQLKHKVYTNNSKDSGLDWNIPKEIQEVKDEGKIQFGAIVEEIKTIFTEGFNYHDILTHIGNIETIEIPIMVEVI